MVHGITEYQMREMNNSNISYRSIAVLLFTILLSSCLKETAVSIESTFTARWGEILSHLTRPKDERGYDLSETGVSDIFFQEAADGFCS